MHTLSKKHPPPSVFLSLSPQAVGLRTYSMRHYHCTHLRKYPAVTHDMRTSSIKSDTRSHSQGCASVHNKSHLSLTATVIILNVNNDLNQTHNKMQPYQQYLFRRQAIYPDLTFIQFSTELYIYMVAVVCLDSCETSWTSGFHPRHSLDS